jgi:integrase
LSVWRSKRVTAWSLTYRSPITGARRRTMVGYWPAMGLRAARDRAGLLRNQVVAGIDPALPPTPRVTLGDAWERYRAERLAFLKAGHEVVKTVGANIPDLLERPLAEITRRMILEVHGAIVARGAVVHANRFATYMATFFDWCCHVDLIEKNPATGLRAAVGAPERSRERVLTEDEIRALWRATADGSAFSRVVRLLLVSGQRRSEIGDLQAAWIQPDGWVEVPGSCYKNGRAHRWYATELARAQLPAQRPDGRLFPVMSYGREKTELDARSGAHAWTLHDLRRTWATRAMERGERSEVVEAVLGHAHGGGGLKAIYRRYDYATEKREAMERWSRDLAALVE